MRLALILLIAVASLPASAPGQGVVPARVRISQPLVHVENGRLTGCGIRTAGEADPDLSFDTSLSLFRGPGGKEISLEFTLIVREARPAKGAKEPPAPTPLNIPEAWFHVSGFTPDRRPSPVPARERGTYRAVLVNDKGSYRALLRASIQGYLIGLRLENRTGERVIRIGPQTGPDPYKELISCLFDLLDQENR